MKTYRNIYFYGSSITQGNGHIDVFYSGFIFNNAKQIKNFSDTYDETKDLLIVCGSCAAKKYGKFIKVKK